MVRKRSNCRLAELASNLFNQLAKNFLEHQEGHCQSLQAEVWINSQTSLFTAGSTGTPTDNQCSRKSRQSQRDILEKNLISLDINTTLHYLKFTLLIKACPALTALNIRAFHGLVCYSREVQDLASAFVSASHLFNPIFLSLILLPYCCHNIDTWDHLT